MRRELIALLLALSSLSWAAPGSGEALQGDVGRRASSREQDLAPTPAFSEESARVAQWIHKSNDNGSLPYIIVDKKAAALHIFSPEGETLASAPILIGAAIGDDASPGVGAKSLAQVGPAERTTPSGRYLAKFGTAFGKQKVLWVDYATSVALHPIPVGNKKERRRQRMLSQTIDDNRITFGCINVPAQLYSRSVRPLFQKRGGYVYVLPDTKPLEVVFPRLRLLPFLSANSS